ncbi:MAG: hypothetical protein LBV58_02695 [Acholeplasmatales bacterium]|jgi:hypothetical protein|nr:hypothetical protein [Acholeplasmatales bacterium]
MITNSLDLEFLNLEGLLGCFISKEVGILDLENLIAKKGNLKIFYLVEGYQQLFFTRRPLAKIQNNKLEENKRYYLKEKLRKVLKNPIYENKNGFFVFRENKFYLGNDLINNLGLDYLFIDNFFDDDKYSGDILQVIDGSLNMSDVDTKYKVIHDNYHLTAKFEGEDE